MNEDIDDILLQIIDRELKRTTDRELKRTLGWLEQSTLVAPPVIPDNRSVEELIQDITKVNNEIQQLEQESAIHADYVNSLIDTSPVTTSGVIDWHNNSISFVSTPTDAECYAPDPTKAFDYAMKLVEK